MNAQVESREFSLAGADNSRLANFAGPTEQNLRHVEERLGVEVRRRGHDLQVLGPAAAVTNATAVLARMYELSAQETLRRHRHHQLGRAHERHRQRGLQHRPRRRWCRR